MSLASTRPQMSGQLELFAEGRGEASRVSKRVEVRASAKATERSGRSELMVKVLERQNLQRALKKVTRKKGSAGIDGMTVEELPEYLRGHWAELREQLRTGQYRPLPVKQQQIPKSGGGMRQLGIPTVVDRFIQ